MRHLAIIVFILFFEKKNTRISLNMFESELQGKLELPFFTTFPGSFGGKQVRKRQDATDRAVGVLRGRILSRRRSSSARHASSRFLPGSCAQMDGVPSTDSTRVSSTLHVAAGHTHTVSGSGGISPWRRRRALACPAGQPWQPLDRPAPPPLPAAAPSRPDPASNRWLLAKN